MRKESLIVVFLFMLSISQKGYGQLLNGSENDSTSEAHSLYRIVLEERDFNQGMSVSIFDLLKAKVPGLSIYKRGSDPNGEFAIRLRGLSTLQSNDPLLVVNGIIVTATHLVDPADIKEIRVLRDVVASSRYGSRGSFGAIEIETITGQNSVEDGITVDVKSYASVASKSRVLPVMGAQQYVSSGGNNLGGNTDWQDLVSRSAGSYVNHISVAGKSGSTSYQLSSNFRNVNGVLLASGFDRMNGRAGIQHTALDSRLNINLGLSSTKQEADYSFSEAFRYANLFNPTAPVRFENGNFYQPILFDNFNPLSIVELNINDGQRKDLSYYADASLELTSAFSVTSTFSQEFNSASYGEFYPSTSFFRGLNANGLASRSFMDRRSTYWESRGLYESSINERIDLSVTAGYSYFEEFREGLSLSMGNLPTNDLGYYGIDLSADRVLGLSNNSIFSSSLDSYATPEDQLIALFSHMSIAYDEAFSLFLSLRREGSSKLGENSKWGFFPAASLGIDLKKFWDTRLFDQLGIRIGSGITGNLPDESGLAQDLYIYDFSFGGTVNKRHDANPDLKWEEIQEFNFGMDFALLDNKLRGSLDIYNRTASDLILEVSVPVVGTSSGSQYQNVAEFQNKGWELSLNYPVVQSSGFNWTSGLLVSNYSITPKKYSRDEFMYASAGAPGQGSLQFLRFALGEELGQIWGPVFSGEVDVNGFPIMEDINGDGNLSIDSGSALSENGDFKKLGSAVPDLEIGWTNTVNYGAFTFDLFFAGAVGHSLVNTSRLYYEPRDPGAINSYNRIVTDKALDELSVSFFNSHFVEKADYLRLEYLKAIYNFDVKGLSSIRALSAFVTVHNLFTITGYTGLNPEPIMGDWGPTDNGGRLRNRDPLAMGIDRRNSYLPARTLIAGIRMSF